MNTFSISQLEQFSGIKAHTIRIWEQRYNALSPMRSDGNTRHYDGSQLRRLLNISTLLKSDHKVSELCSMSDKQLHDLIKAGLKKSPGNDDNTAYFVTQLIAAGMCYDGLFFEEIFEKSINRFGFRITYIKIIQPLLLQVGLMWLTDSIPIEQEHFISNIIRQKLFAAIDALPQVQSLTGGWLLFLPENEFHEISLLFSYFLIRSAKQRATYLGSNVPIESLNKIIDDVKPLNLLIFLVKNDMPSKTMNYIDLLSETFSKLNIYISGNAQLIGQVKTKSNIHWLKTVEDLEQHLV